MMCDITSEEKKEIWVQLTDKGRLAALLMRRYGVGLSVAEGILAALDGAYGVKNDL